MFKMMFKLFANVSNSKEILWDFSAMSQYNVWNNFKILQLDSQFNLLKIVHHSAYKTTYKINHFRKKSCREGWLISSW